MKKALSLLLTFLIITSVFVMGIGNTSAVSSVTSIKVSGINQSAVGSMQLDSELVGAEKYIPKELTDSQFLMYTDDVFSVTGRGIVLTGRVLNGRVNTGDTIKVTYYDGTNAVTEEMTAEAISMFGKSLVYAEKGDNIGLLIGMPYGTNDDGSINKGKIKIGTVVQGTSNTIPPITEMVGTFKMLSTEEGGKYTSIEKGFRPQAYIGTSDVTCTFLDLNGKAIQAGETRKNVKLGDFYHGVVVYKGQEISIRQDGRIVGTFTVGDTNTAITSVKVTGVKQPVAGEHPDYSGIKLETVPANAAKIVETCWKNRMYNNLANDDIFIDGEIYLVYFTIRPNEGYYFEFDEDIQYNGETAIEGYTVDCSEERFNKAGSLYLDSKYTVAVSSSLCADVDMDGTISIMDATLIQKHLAELVTLTDEQLKAADVNFDKEVSIMDVTEIQKYIADLISHFG